MGVIFDREMYVEKPAAADASGEGGDGGVAADGYGGVQMALQANQVLKAYK